MIQQQWFRIVLTILLNLFLSSLVLANADICQKALRGFVATQPFYKNGLCCDNAFKLLQKIREISPSETFENSQILYIYSRWSGEFHYLHLHNYFRPFLSRQAVTPRWGFHVVLLHNDQIYDFDTGPNPQPLAIHDYFERMLGSFWRFVEDQWRYQDLRQQYFIENDLELPLNSQLKMHIRSIPAQTYLQEYTLVQPYLLDPTTKGFKYWLNANEYPDQTLESFLWPFRVEPTRSETNH